MPALWHALVRRPVAGAISLKSAVRALVARERVSPARIFWRRKRAAEPGVEVGHLVADLIDAREA